MANRMYQQQMDFQNQNGNQMGFNPIDQINQLRSNPLRFLANKGLNIPPQYANDPKGAVQYLMNNGQMNQGMLNNLMQRAQMMGYKF